MFCLYTYSHGVIHWSRVGLLGATPLKKTEADSLPSRNHGLSIAPQPGVGVLVSPSPHHAGMFAALILCRPSCRQPPLLRVHECIAPKDTVLLQFTLTLALKLFLLSVLIPATWGEGRSYRCPICC